MKKKQRGMAIVASSVLAMSLLGFSTSVHTSASVQTVSKNYLIAYSQSLPKNYLAEIKNAGGEVLRAMPEVGGLEVRSSNPNFLSQLKSSATIVAANSERVYKLEDGTPEGADGKRVDITPDADGTYWSSQWDIRHLTNKGKSFAIESGGAKTASGKVTHKAVVGVIDSGIDAGHPDLIANFIGGMNFVPAGGYFGGVPEEKGKTSDVTDTNGHGTHVAGSIAGNGKIKGVGPDLGIRAYRIFDASGSAPTSPIVEAIVQAANDSVDVINMSIGGFDNLKYYLDGTRFSDIADVLLWKRAIRYAVNKNVTVVASAGNSSLDFADKKSLTDYMNVNYGGDNLVYKGVAINTPGGLPGVITVSSSNEWSTDNLAFYSNYGNGYIDVAAPGGDNGPVYDGFFRQDPAGDYLSKRDFTYRALSTWPRGLGRYATMVDNKGYAYLHGTSMASPKVAGIAGVIKAAHPNYTPAQVKALIEKTALDYGKKGHDELFGSGEANAYTALTGK
ncbi:S8 family serine peptidase [Paenibacillus sp. BSR1-1]|uniref:S8 family serine peptidase n=1 Tax=Paenibacillus sp. BSR1-1 TaxID=3020845 RepID=UPI0025AF30C6|nr:S8 family serine peptidase [Paenibacillus sp. BSR1-1]MDN3017885.1 S8 family serine peptidase [Paenibacillus sp. BSR1-1]